MAHEPPAHVNVNEHVGNPLTGGSTDHPTPQAPIIKFEGLEERCAAGHEQRIQDDMHVGFLGGVSATAGWAHMVMGAILLGVGTQSWLNDPPAGQSQLNQSSLTGVAIAACLVLWIRGIAILMKKDWWTWRATHLLIGTGCVAVFYKGVVSLPPFQPFVPYQTLLIVQGVLQMTIAIPAIVIWKTLTESIKIAQVQIVLFLSYCACIVAGLGWVHFAYYHDTESALQGSAAIAVMLMVVLYYFRRSSVEQNALAKISGDMDKYATCWSELENDPKLQEVVEELDTFCQSLDDPKPVTQPWNSISQIYKVALDVNEPFQEMCQLWANRSGAVRFKRCLTVKKEARAIQKVWRSYKGQPKKLLDIVRSSIVFDSLEKLLGCLQIIAASEDVEVLRIKNRFALGYDPTESAGFRNLSSNLRLRESGFVVELQLHLTSMIQIQSDDGHKRYVEFRDSQGD